MRSDPPIKRVLEEWGIDPALLPEDDDDLPDFGGPEEDEDDDWSGEFDDDDPYGPGEDSVGERAPAAPGQAD